MVPENVARVINRLEKIMDMFFQIKHLPPARIVKYHWDNFDIMASIIGPEDALERNIVANVSEDGRYVRYEANVWSDDETTLKRHWVHRYFGAVYIEQHTEMMLALSAGLALEHILTEIVKVKKEDLVNTSALQPRPR